MRVDDGGMSGKTGDAVFGLLIADLGQAGIRVFADLGQAGLLFLSADLGQVGLHFLERSAMATTGSQQTADFFHSYAHDFDAIYGTKHTFLNKVVNSLFRKSMRIRYEKSILGCDPIEGKSVLDVGCGPGHFAIALAKRGASRVLGLDFAEGMLDVARRNAQAQGVDQQCEWQFGDFNTYEFNEKFDYCIVCGFMDYMEDPKSVIQKVLDHTQRRAFFSFPADGGVLAWQRKRRYQSKCPLYLYTSDQITQLFRSVTDKPFKIEPIARDYFVTVYQEGQDG